MTKLEFIDKYIELLKAKIKGSKELARIYYANDDYEFGKMEEENSVGYEEELEMFQQIKQDLEAWEVVKDKIFYGVGRCLIDSSVWFGEEAETIKKSNGGRVMIIVTVNHVNYNGTFKPDKYWFKSNDDLKCNDYVYCDTKYGCVKGIVSDIYKTIDELIKAKVVVNFSDLKECCKIEVEE